MQVTGTLLFGGGDLLEGALEGMHSQEPVKVVILDMSNVSAIDVSGLEVGGAGFSRVGMVWQDKAGLPHAQEPVKVVILDMSSVSAIDVSSLEVGGFCGCRVWV
jgi:anti-anti-sigma regulatory factor